jgi:hypothetical protein
MLPIVKLLFASAMCVLAGAGGIATTATTAAAMPSSPIAAYSLAAPVSVTPSGLVARAVVPAGSACPSLVADGKVLPMQWRRAAPNTGAAFSPVLVCNRAIPVGTTSASVGGLRIPASMPARVTRLGIFDDTGCRIRSGDETQDCANDRAWPLARIARRVAASRPQVVLMPGDFFYRESACPPSEQALCAGSPPPVAGMPFTDQAYGWIADALLPLQPVLRTAPLIVARGNHEACWRAGNGFMLFMDPRPKTWDDCAPVRGPGGALTAPEVVTAPYPIDLPVGKGRTLRLVIADTSEGSDTHVTTAAALMAPRFAAAARMAAPVRGRESWLVTHRPLFGFWSLLRVQPGRSPWVSADAVAAARGTLGNYRLIASGHVHVAQAVQVPGQPGQLVLGNGSTELEPPTGYATPDFGPGSPPYPAPTWSWTLAEFGYAIGTPGARPGRWTLRLRDMDGRRQATCAVAGRTIRCAPVRGAA